jgi:hypothetical protein
LLKLIRNVADNQPDLVRGFDLEIVEACTRHLNRPPLVDVLAVANRGEMNSERAKFCAAQQPLVHVFLAVLGNELVSPQLHLECVMFISAMVLYSAAAQALGK